MTFTYTGGPESKVFETVHLFGRYNRMMLAERTEHSMVICRGSWLTMRNFVSVFTHPEGDRVEVTLQAWWDNFSGRGWNANPNEFLGSRTAWSLAVALARALGVAQPENLFVHSRL